MLTVQYFEEIKILLDLKNNKKKERVDEVECCDVLEPVVLLSDGGVVL